MDEQEQGNTESSPAAPPRLVRSKTDRFIAGVCGGIAEYYGIRPVVVRIIFILLTALDGLGLILYLLAVVFIPDAPGPQAVLKPQEKLKEFVADAQNETQRVAAQVKGQGGWFKENRDILKTVLLGIIILALLSAFFPYHFLFLTTELLWILFVVLIVVYFIHNK